MISGQLLQTQPRSCTYELTEICDTVHNSSHDQARRSPNLKTRKWTQNSIPSQGDLMAWPCAHILGQASTLSSWATQIELNEFKVEENTKLGKVGRWRWIWVGGEWYAKIHCIKFSIQKTKLFKQDSSLAVVACALIPSEEGRSL